MGEKTILQSLLFSSKSHIKPDAKMLVKRRSRNQDQGSPYYKSPYAEPLSLNFCGVFTSEYSVCEDKAVGTEMFSRKGSESGGSAGEAPSEGGGADPICIDTEV